MARVVSRREENPQRAHEIFAGLADKKWRPICYTVHNASLVFEFPPNRFSGSVLRFNPIQIAEWLDDLLGRKEFETQRALSRELGMSQTRIGQFLSLMKLPAETRGRLRGKMEGVGC